MDDTARVNRGTIIEDMLDEISTILDRAPDCSDVRSLRMQAGRLRRSLEQWSLVRPERDQLSAMHEIVVQLHDGAHRYARHTSGIEIPSTERVTVRAIRLAPAR
jgi:hypothetical protein